MTITKTLAATGIIALAANVNAGTCYNNKYKSGGCNYSGGKCNGYNSGKSNSYGKSNGYSNYGCTSGKGKHSGKGNYGCYNKSTKTVTTSKETTTRGALSGTLDLNKLLVEEGKEVELTWNVSFPTTVVEDVVDIEEDGEITAKTKLLVEFYMVGAAVSNHRGYTKTFVKIGSGSWKKLYEGYGTDIDRNKVIVSGYAYEGDKVQFASYYSDTVGWVYNTSDNAIVMRDGDIPDSKEGWGGDSSMEDYVRPYMNDDGSMKLGSLDLMIAAELTHTQSYKSSSGYDSNDSIALIRFTPAND
jgi:hypothetical protein